MNRAPGCDVNSLTRIGTKDRSGQGDAEAPGDLGWMYAIGLVVTQDNVEGHMWLTIAASRSTGEERERAVTLRDDLATRMTPADLSEAQRRAMEWHEAHPVPLYF